MKQPIFHSDLATGIMNSLHDPEAVGQTYEAMGSQRLTQVPNDCLAVKWLPCLYSLSPVSVTWSPTCTTAPLATRSWATLGSRSSCSAPKPWSSPLSLNGCPCLDKSMFCMATLLIVWRGNVLFNGLTITSLTVGMQSLIQVKDILTWLMPLEWSLPPWRTKCHLRFATPTMMKTI